ncbi:MAG TPA: 3-methyl-2-oxobutanoate dehydrogenase subunit VorB [Candidatus Brocadiales bacterium]|nr:3-methyl-2-oxobutanoate dehydrogenase subunit VorB [Candidatus Brocadiales bacterium]
MRLVMIAVGEKVLMRGCEAMAEAAIRAGCRFYAGYPITPQSELAEYMARELPKYGGVFIQSESEIAAINMVLGASVTGTRAMTSSSSPGISLKQEGISYLAGCELPAVIANFGRGGPGLGNIAPSDADYFQATKGGGHGDYHNIVLAPYSVQETVELTHLAFDLADRYRNPALILCSGLIAQMMEPVEFMPPKEEKEEKPWALTGARGRPSMVIKSLYLQDVELEGHDLKLQEKYREIREKEVRVEAHHLEGGRATPEERAKLVVVAFGTAARVAASAVEEAREEGLPVGLIRPITLFPFPRDFIRKAAEGADRFLVLELSGGQMVEDVELAVRGRVPVEFYGRMGGVMPSPEEYLAEIRKRL